MMPAVSFAGDPKSKCVMAVRSRGCVVRSGVEKTSAQVAEVREGTFLVCESMGFAEASDGTVRVRVAAPAEGWVSAKTLGHDHAEVVFPRASKRPEAVDDVDRDLLEFLALARTAETAAAAAAALAAAAAVHARDTGGPSADGYDACLRSAYAANDADLAAVGLAARARCLLACGVRSREAAADAMRAVSLFGGGARRFAGDRDRVKACAARLARTCAAALAAHEASRPPAAPRGAGCRLGAAYAHLAAKYEPDLKAAAADEARRDALLAAAGVTAVPALDWRRQLCHPDDVAEAASGATTGPARVVVVGLGCGRCGTSSLAELLRACGGRVTHESNQPDCRVTLWDPDEAREAVVARRLAHWRARAGPAGLAGDVNYAHLPRAGAYLAAGDDVRVVAVRRDRAATVKSYAAWTEPGGAGGSLRSRDHWTPHDGGDRQLDEWDLTFPKFPGATSKLGAIGAYYDAYDAGLEQLRARHGDGRVLVLESPRLFDDAGLQRKLFAFLGLRGAAPVTGLHANAQAYGA